MPWRSAPPSLRPASAASATRATHRSRPADDHDVVVVVRPLVSRTLGVAGPAVSRAPDSFFFSGGGGI